MVVIRTNSTTSISQPSRYFTDGLVDVSLQDEQLNSWVDFQVTASYTLGKLEFDYDFGGIEGRNYYVIIKQTDEEVVKFKMFCTDQTDLQDYNPTEGDYKEAPQTNNSYIVPE